MGNYFLSCPKKGGRYVPVTVCMLECRYARNCEERQKWPVPFLDEIADELLDPGQHSVWEERKAGHFSKRKRKKKRKDRKTHPKERQVAVKTFRSIRGIGRKTAEQLVDEHGILTLDDLGTGIAAGAVDDTRVIHAYREHLGLSDENGAAERTEKKIMEKARKRKKKEALKLFRSVRGIGKKTARRLVEEHGLRELEELGERISAGEITSSRVIRAYHRHLGLPNADEAVKAARRKAEQAEKEKKKQKKKKAVKTFRSIRGIGKKTARSLVEEHGLRDLDELGNRIDAGDIANSRVITAYRRHIGLDEPKKKKKKKKRKRTRSKSSKRRTKTQTGRRSRKKKKKEKNAAGSGDGYLLHFTESGRVELLTSSDEMPSILFGATEPVDLYELRRRIRILPEDAPGG